MLSNNFSNKHIGSIVLFESEIINIPVTPGDWLGHSDGIVRFINRDTVFVNYIDSENIIEKNYFEALTKIISQHGLHWEILIKGNNKKFKGAEGLYLNYLKVGNLIVVPEYGIPEDEIAFNELSSFYPEKIWFHLSRIILQKAMVRCDVRLG